MKMTMENSGLKGLTNYLNIIIIVLIIYDVSSKMCNFILVDGNYINGKIS